MPLTAVVVLLVWGTFADLTAVGLISFTLRGEVLADCVSFINAESRTWGFTGREIISELLFGWQVELILPSWGISAKVPLLGLNSY